MIYYFNPGHEMAVLNALPYYTLPSNLALMQQELAFLPAWYARAGEAVMVLDDIDDYVHYLKEHLAFGIDPIHPKRLKKSLHNEVCLWGISPQSIQVFEDIKHKYELDIHIPKWDDSYIYLNSRKANRACLTQILDALPQISCDIIPAFYSRLEDIEEAVNQSPLPLLAKAPYSSSGRGLLRLPISGLTRTEKQNLQGMLNKQREVSLEILLDKQIDFAMEFMSDGCGTIQFVGYSLFNTNEKGVYLGNFLDSQSNIEKEVTQYIDQSLLHSVQTALEHILSHTYAIYKGCIGVDMLVYKDEGGYKLHPCIEVNMRYNMGYLACRFSENYLANHSKGFFHIAYNAKAGDAYANHMAMQEQYPTVFVDSKISKGYLSLCPVGLQSRYRAYVLVE